ncbi:MAG: hypothetical protein VX874_18030 [Pseudomonadota bacterium]|nr:hypothetical protein [Pseudomonadota bacterium]
MTRLFAFILCLLLPSAALSQQTGGAGTPEGLFSWTDRPSVTARSQSLETPRSRETKPRTRAINPEAKSETGDDFEMGIEGYVWTGMVLKL